MFQSLRGKKTPKRMRKTAKGDSGAGSSSVCGGKPEVGRLASLRRLWRRILSALRRLARRTPNRVFSELEAAKAEEEIVPAVPGSREPRGSPLSGFDEEEEAVSEEWGGREPFGRSLSTIDEEEPVPYWARYEYDESDDGIDFIHEGEEFLSCIELLFEMAAREKVN